jgi:hypothetical protein
MMKKLGLILFFMLGSLTCFGQYKNQFRAQSANEFAIYDGFIGINFKGEYFPLERFSINPSITFFLPSKGTATGFDVNGRYYITDDRFQVYGLFGYGFFTRKFENINQERLVVHAINAGLGTLVKLSQELGINAEFRVPIPRQEMVFGLGVVYFIN